MNRFLLRSLALVGLLAPGIALSDTLTVNVSSFNFSPSQLNIQLGDTVHWALVNGSHTITSGTGAADPNSGALFDSPLSFANTNFYYTFADTAGTYPYHCTPHEFLGMKATVVVEAPIIVDVPHFDPVELPTTWGELKSLFE